MLHSSDKGRNGEKEDFYSDDYTSNDFGANTSKKGIGLVSFVKK
jgi:hypothetical protein